MIEPQSPAPGQTVFYGVLLAGSGLLLWEAWKIEGFGSLSGPGMFPMIAAGLMVVTVLIMMVKVRRNRAPSVDEAETRATRLARIVTLPILGYMALCAVYVAALELAGFWVASAVFLFVSFVLLYRKGVVAAGLVTAASLAFVFAVFSFIFQVYLP